MTPSLAVLIHASAAIGALVVGPFALWARLGNRVRPGLHRAAGYLWVVLMAATAASALFVRQGHLPNIAGLSPSHLFVPFTATGLYLAFRALSRRDIVRHSRYMQGIYFGACIDAGAFTLLPDRLLGQLVWGDWLGLLA